MLLTLMDFVYFNRGLFIWQTILIYMISHWILDSTRSLHYLVQPIVLQLILSIKVIPQSFVKTFNIITSLCQEFLSINLPIMKYFIIECVENVHIQFLTFFFSES